METSMLAQLGDYTSAEAMNRMLRRKINRLEFEKDRLGNELYRCVIERDKLWVEKSRKSSSSTQEGGITMWKIPLATKEDIKKGWTFNYELLSEVADSTNSMDYPVGAEEVESVLLALMQNGYIVAKTSEEEE